MIKCIAIIPARYGSSRFPGKPLALLGGKPLIQWAYDNAVEAFGRALVATDDSRIFQAVRAFGGDAVMTSAEHGNGTERVHEAYSKLDEEADVIVNYQGDEPFINTESLHALARCFDAPTVGISTLAWRFPPTTDYRQLADRDSTKVVLDVYGNAMYFTRQVVPFVRGDSDPETWVSRYPFYKHIGVYAYRPTVLEEIVRLPKTDLEAAESLEQLRWLQHGYKIRVAMATGTPIGIDTPADLAIAATRLTT